jgi:DNA (cytosine-5)-methyltransferase 1
MIQVRDQMAQLAYENGLKVSNSILPTPTVSDTFTGSLGSTQQKEGSLHSVSLAQVFHREDLFPTPIVSDYKNGKSSPGYGLNLPETAKTLMPTPTTRDHKDGTEPHKRNGIVQTDTVARAVFNSGEVLLPTTRTSMANGPTQKEIKQGNPKSRIETEVMLGETNWGRFDPAIKRWEKVLGRQAPEPTKPDGKDGNHRLSSKFTEWMMGLPDGWITKHGLSRNDELKLAGNGVVPQQAELALRLLLEERE